MILVASYCRVSTDREDQANSFASQQRFFREYIERQPDWKWSQTYADEGITGTSTKKRTEFNRMMDDARLGKFQLILTKEVSRFSRNILDTILYTRELKSLGVGVLFMNDGLNSLEPDAELRLSIMGSIAQEESRRTSARVKWGQTRQMERGVVFGRSLLGYDVKEGKLNVNPAGAEVVRLIFHKYALEKKGTAAIARELEAAGYRTHRGSFTWAPSHIIKILKNEKYVGDLIQKKSYTPDYLTHIKKHNSGAEALVCLRDHHEAIVSRELWNTAQAELEKRSRRGTTSTGHSNRYLFSGKIKCGECGASFVSRKKRRSDGSFYRRWGCNTAATRGAGNAETGNMVSGCGVGTLIRDELAFDILIQTMADLSLDWESIISHVAALALEALRAGRTEGENAERLRGELNTVNRKKTDALDLFLSGRITERELQAINSRYDTEIAALDSRLEAVRKQSGETPSIEKLQRLVSGLVRGTASSDTLYKNILDRITVYADRRVELRLKLLSGKWVFCLTRDKK